MCKFEFARLLGQLKRWNLQSSSFALKSLRDFRARCEKVERVVKKKKNFFDRFNKEISFLIKKIGLY